MTFYLKRIIGKLLLLVIWYLSSKLLKANCCVSLGTTTWYYQRCCTHTKPFSTAFGCAILRWSHISAQVSLKLKTTLSDFPFSFPFLIKNLQPYVRCYFVLVSMCFYKTHCLKIAKKSRIQHCERSELCLHLKCYQTGQNRTKISRKCTKFKNAKCDIF